MVGRGKVVWYFMTVLKKIRVVYFVSVVLFLGTSFFGSGCSKKSLPKPTCSYGEDEFIGGLDGFCEEIAPGRFHLVFKDHSGKEILVSDWPGDLKDPPAVDCQELCEAGALGVAYGTDRLNFKGPERRERQEKSRHYRPKVIACKSDADCRLKCNTCRSYKQACFGEKGCLDCDPDDNRINCLPGHSCVWGGEVRGYVCR